MRQDVEFRSASILGTSSTVIVGTCRSGKTLLGNILATCANAEYAEEPWTAMLLPMAARSGKVDRKFASGWLAAFTQELFNDLILLRQANFRPSDQSTIWTKKTPEQILSRMSGLKSRADVKALVTRDALSLVMTLAECGPFVDLLLAGLPEARFVHVIRNGFEVAADVCAKRWFDDEQLMQPQNAQLYARYPYRGQEYFLPWWVDEGDEADFIESTGFDRAAYYWCSLIEKTEETLRRCPMDTITVRYKALLQRTEEVVTQVCQSTGLRFGALTAARIAEVEQRTELPIGDISRRSLLERVQTINCRLGV